MIILDTISDFDNNLEPIYGVYGNERGKDYAMTVIKGMLILQLYNGCKSTIQIPEIYDSFITLSNGNVMPIKSGFNKFDLNADISGYAIAALKQRNAYTG